MGCGACKHGKVFMPMVSNLEGSILKDYSPYYSSQGPHDSYLSISKSIAKHREEFPPINMDQNGCISPNYGINTDRSRMSQELNTVSKEFKKFLIEYSQNNKFLPQREYKIFVWTSSRELLRKTFPERTVSEMIEIEGNMAEVSFSIYSTSAPVVIDCVLYLITKVEDFKEVYSLNQKYKHVWTQALISSFSHQNFEEISNTLGISMFKQPKELYVKICTDDMKLFNLLKGVFNGIDSNHSGEIEFAELFNAISQIQPELTEEDMRDAIARIDINNDGMISFEEFCFWWKKGRQGAVSVSEIALNWAKQLALNIPETKSLLKNLTRNRAFIEKKMIKKEVRVKVGGNEATNSEIRVEIGKSSMREKLLNEVNSKLSLFNKDLWITLKFTLKNPQVWQTLEKPLKKAVEMVIDSYFSSLMDGKRIKKAVKFSTQLLNNDLFISFILDFTDHYLDPLNKLFFTFDELLTSPTNDNFAFQISSSNKFLAVISPGDIFETLGPSYEIKITSEYWSKFVNVLLGFSPVSSNLHILAYSFLLSIGKSEFAFASASDCSSTFYKLFGKRFEKNTLLSPSVLKFLYLLENICEDSFEFYCRISNVGLKMSVYSKDFFSNIKING